MKKYSVCFDFIDGSSLKISTCCDVNNRLQLLNYINNYMENANFVISIHQMLNSFGCKDIIVLTCDVSNEVSVIKQNVIKYYVV